MVHPRRYRVLGTHLRLVREQTPQRLSVRRAATAAGMDHSVLSRFESGERKPQPEHLRALADAYGAPPEWLLLQAGVMELPGFEELLQAGGDADALDRLFLAANIEEKRELARHLAALRTTGPLIDSLLRGIA